MTRCFTLWLALLLVIAMPVRLFAQEDSQATSSYLDLYPPGDVYQLQVVGDGLTEGLLSGLVEAFRGDQRVAIKPKPLELSTLMRGEYTDQLKALDEGLAREQPTVAVVMIGPQRRISMKGSNGRKVWIDSDEWRAEFGRQVDTVMKTFKRRKVAVYWVSLPNVRDGDVNEDVQVLNEIIRERSYLNGLKYIDAFAGFSDDGGYNAMGPDLSGKMRLLREPNGVNFTDLGNRKLAHFVERELRRDLTQAKSDRTIPLAGSEAEQAAISAARLAALRVQRPAAPAGTPSSALSPVAPVEGAPSAVSANGDTKADSGRINLAIVVPGGREEMITVDLLRPAIPATIIALVNRKENAEKPTQLGDLLIDQIPGGLMVMSSITPATDPNSGETRRRLSPTQTPYFRVMVKGERIAPRADRADDVSWPRPEPPPVADPAVPAVANPKAIATSPAKKPVSAKKSDPGTQPR